MLTGTQHLALAILIQAIEDSSEDIYQEDVGIFLDSVWFEMLVEGLEQEPSDFRSKIKNNEISLDGYMLCIDQRMEKERNALAAKPKRPLPMKDL